MAGECAKVAVESVRDAIDRRYLRDASLAHLTRAMTEARTRSTRDWITSHVKSSQQYRPPKGGSIRLDLGRERKEIAGRCYQLLSGYAATGAYLAERIVPSSRASAGGAVAERGRPAVTSSSRLPQSMVPAALN